MENYNQFVKEFKEYQSGESNWYKGLYDDPSNSNNTREYGFNKEWGASGKQDDPFFLQEFEGGNGNDKYREENVPYEPIVPSPNYKCQDGWLSIRSEMNYKYLWMHTGENMWMGATATMDTPLHRKSFKVYPVVENCGDGGWVMLQEGDSEGFIMMVGPSATAAGDSDEWVVKIGTANQAAARNDSQYHFLIEADGYMLNRGAMAMVNVMPESEYAVRGHSGGWDRKQPAGREYGAMMHFQYINSSFVEDAIRKEQREETEANEQDQKYIQQIASFPQSSEKRVISFGLYGAKPKYTMGAIKNVQLAATYFPGWVCRFYFTSDVPEDVKTRLAGLGAELLPIPGGMGYTSGMFWRFMVAADPTVDRYIVRDTDSRLNSRDRYCLVGLFLDCLLTSVV